MNRKGVLSTSLLRTGFIAGTIIFGLAFLGLSFDTIRQIPARTNEQALSAQAVSGKVAWQAHDCTDCHTLLGNGAYFAPDLTTVTARRGDAFVQAWLAKPSRQMPDQHLAQAEVSDLAAFLAWVGQIDTNGWPPKPIFQVSANAGDLAGQGDVAKGASLFQQRGCAGCHGAKAEGTAAGPALAPLVNQRTDDYLARWLANPVAVNPAAKMPNMSLAADEVIALVAYVRTVK